VDLAPDSLERLIPDQLEQDDATGRETLRLHLERYEFAAQHARGGRALDMACGVGYGSRLLFDRTADTTTVVGVDISEAALDYARTHYLRDGLEYRCCDAMRFEDSDGFDLIVSLETIEHLPDPAAFARRLPSLLRPGGVLIASVPTTPSVDLNPHHTHDFSEASFRRLLAPLGLVEIDALRQVQPVAITAILMRRETRMADLRRNLALWYLQHPGALARRIGTTLTHGFANHYLTLALRRDG
jgi:2-polyprenyl-3-methyl-5-hydroxy-6-metoxy-1,4-benzoquinol methylase